MRVRDQPMPKVCNPTFLSLYVSIGGLIQRRKKMAKDIEPPWVVGPMNATRFERMTLWISALLESHALPLRHASKVWIRRYLEIPVAGEH
jgi:hypothetical protein